LDLKQISDLASGNSVMIKFIHSDDGLEHVFCSTINSLSGNRLAWFDTARPVIDDDNSHTKTVIKNLYKRAKILSHETNCKTFGVPKI
jgi:hypothetical protein